MALDFTPFKVWHLGLLCMPAADELAAIPEAARLELEFSATGWDGDHIVGCAGINRKWNGVYSTWAFLTPESGRHMLQITRFVRTALNEHPEARRIEAQALVTFPPAQRWAIMLGFELETPKPMAAFSPDGTAAYQYAKVL